MMQITRNGLPVDAVRLRYYTDMEFPGGTGVAGRGAPGDWLLTSSDRQWIEKKHEFNLGNTWSPQDNEMLKAERSKTAWDSVVTIGNLVIHSLCSCGKCATCMDRKVDHVYNRGGTFHFYDLAAYSEGGCD